MENVSNIKLHNLPDGGFKLEVEHSRSGGFPLIIYDKLPPIMLEGCHPFRGDKHDLDVIVFSMLITLSACFPRLSGIYAGSRCFANLYGIILAPPASSKGIAKFGVQFAKEFHKYLLHKTHSEAEVAVENTEKQTKESISKRFFISANSSAAALFADIRNCENEGCLMFDSELDIAALISKQDWGNLFSEVLRKCYHHEMLSASRKGEGILEIESPKLSVLFTGTANQLNGLIRSVSDGLFSRFLFYKFNTPPIWKDVSYQGGIKLDDYFADLSRKLLEIIQYYLQADFEFNLSPWQSKAFNDMFSFELKCLSDQYGEEIQSVVKRMGLITFRIAMILAALRFWGKEEPILICADDDFKLAFEFYSTFIHHATKIYKEITGENYDWSTEKLKSFYGALPGGVFKRDEAIEVAAALGIPERTADYHLKKWKIEGRLTSPDAGMYRKAS